MIFVIKNSPNRISFKRNKYSINKGLRRGPNSPLNDSSEKKLGDRIRATGALAAGAAATAALTVGAAATGAIATGAFAAGIFAAAHTVALKKIGDHVRSNEQETSKFEKSMKTFEKDIEEAMKIEKANHDKIMLKLEKQSKHLDETNEINRKEISGLAQVFHLNSLFINSDPYKILFHFFLVFD